MFVKNVNFLHLLTTLTLLTIPVKAKLPKKTKAQKAYERLLDQRKLDSFISKEITTHKKLTDQLGIEIKRSPKSTKTDRYRKSSEQIFNKELLPLIKEYNYQEEQNPDGIFDKNNAIYWLQKWNTDYPKHWRIVQRANKLIASIKKHLVKHKNNTDYTEYLRSEDFKLQSKPEDFLDKLTRLGAFLNTRINQYEKLTEPPATVKRLQKQTTDLLNELSELSQQHFDYVIFNPLMKINPGSIKYGL